ncbi:MAG TPA: DUF364 domain-containing protein [Candidatus Ozemobacteraceae bacterium]|nr:DUF364 domain-containing protein [Candidatus Ozemobacteraceae bacterium]
MNHRSPTPSNVIDAVKSAIPAGHLAARVRRVAIYAFMTIVRTDQMGMSMTLLDDRIYTSGIHAPVRQMGQVEQLCLAELLTWTDSHVPLERSIGMAALNAAVLPPIRPCVAGNALELAASRARGKRAVVIGHFPHLEEIRRVASAFHILEKRPQPGDLPAEAAPQVIPDADVVAMTGVTCLNDTIDDLLRLKKPGSTWIVLGPTVPLSPVLFEFGVDVIGGAWAEEPDTVEAMMSQGGTARCIPGLRSVLMPRDMSLVGNRPVLPPPPPIETRSNKKD